MDIEEIKRFNEKNINEIKLSNEPEDIELLYLINYLKTFYDNEEYDEEYDNYLTSLGYV